METDQYGVPLNLLPKAPEEFYGRLGRIVHLAALLETRLYDLYCRLSGFPPEDRAGDRASAIIKACEELAGGLDDESMCASVVEFLERARSALETRNAVVHSLWPTEGVGWRYVGKKRRKDDGRMTATTGIATQDLRGVVTELVFLCERCRDIESRLPAPGPPRPPDSR
jgi:hypothetical protein